MTDEKILQAVLKLQRYIESEDYQGYDPYDALRSPLFKLPFFRTSKILRFAVQQAVKRSPVNLRPWLRISKGRNPVTLGLCIQAYASLILLRPHDISLAEKSNRLVAELVKCIPAGFHGACWGYDFDWQARHANIPAYQPTVVATGIITHALFRLYTVTGNQQAFELCRSAVPFILEDLNRTAGTEGDFCFSYSPFDRQRVFNASMKAVRILAQVYSVTGEENLKAQAGLAVKFVIRHQQESGAWNYSLADGGGWVDNYHTGYILDCLDEYIRHTGDRRYDRNLEQGFRYYKDHFFEHNTLPKFFDNRLYPVDSTAAAQSMLTLSRFHEMDLAKKVAAWMIGNMQGEKGHFYFRKYRYHTEKTSFMRWSNAWMFAGLSSLLGPDNS